MDNLSDLPVSYWIDSTKKKSFKQQNRNLKTDIAILGGGIVGITTAFLLNKEGINSLVIEARKILEGTTGHTTAKITSQHRLIYDYLINKFGKERAKQYADANQSAIELINNTVTNNNIDCNFIRKPSYVYTESDAFIKNIEKETKSAKDLGLPAEYVTDTSLPFQVKCAVKFNNQAQFHPLKFLVHLANKIQNNGCEIFEKTRVMKIEGNSPYTIITDMGNITAKKVVVATHYPIFDKPGLYFSRLYASRSYVLGMRTKEKLPDGMYISADNPVHSFRTQPVNNDTMLLLGGEGHKTGQGDNTIFHYKRLEDYAKRIYSIESLDYYWSTQDCITVDGVPYIGRITPGSENLFTATGFNKWGMTNGTAAAMILRDMILEQNNPWLEVFSPSRFKVFASTGEFIKQNINVASEFIGGKLNVPDSISGQLEKGEGKVLTIQQKKLAVYKDEKGILHITEPSCTHLGCQIKWNHAEKTWDCPCHGSRFTFDGEVIQGPAVKKLKKYEINYN